MLGRNLDIVPFANRTEAGQQLAHSLAEYHGRADVVVLGLPRGGVPVAFEIAKELDAPLDVFLVRKLGVPGHEELAMGAIASGGVQVLNRDVVREARVSQESIAEVAHREHQELERREKAYRGERPQIDLQGKIAILVDDGLATGATMRAAVQGLRQHQPAQIIVAVPVAAPEVCQTFEALVDKVICLKTPRYFGGVGMWFEAFSQTSNDQVRHFLKEAASFGDSAPD